MVGIGGAGMKALAEFLLEAGWQISGSDNSMLPDSLQQRGAELSLGHSANEIPDETELVIYSPAIRETNAVLQAAGRRSLPTLSYTKTLATLSREHETFCVAGTHGKSTTSAFLAHLLDEPDNQCGAIIGAETIDRKASGWCGTGQRLVLESCEYQRHFLQFDADRAIITNVEPDHFDCYPQFEQATQAYAEFATRLPGGGVLVIPEANNTIEKIAQHAAAQIVTFGIDRPADWTAGNVAIDEQGTRFDLFQETERLGTVELQLAGRHNVANALAAMALAGSAGVGTDRLIERAGTFHGIRRRMERIAENERFLLMDDYAHHPTALRALFEALKRTYPGRPIRCAFQPHQISRTEHLFDQFVESLTLADDILLAPVFTARESDESDAMACSSRLAEACRRKGQSAFAVESLDQIASTLEDKAAEGDILLTVGAGDINRIHHELIGRFFGHSQVG
jgi:UDP-N-acetylmuramate--alanine ligase